MKPLRAPGVLFPNWTHNKVALYALLALCILGAVFILPVIAEGDTAEELQQKIADRNAKIAELEKDIAAYENSLTKIGSQKKTLEGEVARLDLSRKKIGADISVTENRIQAAELELEELDGAIGDKQSRIKNGKAAIGKSLRDLYELGDTTLVEQLLTADGLTEAWQEQDKLRQLDTSIRFEIAELENVKEALTIDYHAVQDRQAKLVLYKRELSGQKMLLDQNRKEQALLLSQTKNKESEYQKILQEKQSAKAAFEQELHDFEAALQYTLDPSKIPAAGSGILRFPLDPTFMARCKNRQPTFGNIYCITQYFGNTPFAKSGAYNGKGHNGVDFGTPEGTKVVAALSGVVVGTGNTDIYRGCYSYGKWVLVQHANGLSTVYGHMSLVSVIPGDVVPTGALLGYTGKTGYATGPHLHLSVFATDAVKLTHYGDVRPTSKCAQTTIPIAPTEGYLNPMSYL